MYNKNDWRQQIG